MGQSNYVHLEDCRIIRKSEKAFLIEYREEQFWLPLSQIADPEDLKAGTSGVTVSITEWIATLKGIDPDV